MNNIVVISDFVGSSELPQGKFSTKFNAIRDEFQSDYLYQLLGGDLGTLFIADLDANGVPQTARFLAIFNAFQEDLANGNFVNEGFCKSGVVISKGIKFFIQNIVWFYAARNNAIKITLAANITSKSENSELNTDGQQLARNYNKAINTGRAIQWYINENSTDYPEYNGQRLDYCLGI